MGDKDPAQFTEGAAGKIVETVRTVKGWVRGHPAIRRRPVPGDDGTEILYGRAKTGTSNSGHTATVNPCDDLLGTNTDIETEHTVNTRFTDKQDPNVQVDDILAYVQNGDDTYSAIQGDNLQAKIGDYAYWYDKDNIPAGWVLADGTGGTTDMQGMCAFGYKAGGTFGTMGTTGGDEDHTHDNHDGHTHLLSAASDLNDTTGTTNFRLTSCVSDANSAQTHSTTAHLPPWAVTGVWIKRTT